MKAWVPLAALGLALSPLAFIHPATVSGRSMEPTLRSGERIWVLRAWLASGPQPGQIWYLDGPDGPVVKRVAAIGPDGALTVLGDNPEHSADSRTWGTLPVRACRGRVLGR